MFLPRRQRRTHYRNADKPATACGVIVHSSSGFPMTDCPDDVNCRSCQRVLSAQTTTG